MAGETLMFRKGTQQALKNLAITPGAISITIDEPGMYIDLPAGHGHAADYRVRIGDVITVKTLKELEELKANPNNISPEDLYVNNDENDTLDLHLNEYSKSALYYVEDHNMLLKYNGTNFVWVNNVSDLRDLIAGLRYDVDALTAVVGEAADGDKEATGLFKKIDDETARATEAEADLQAQINALTGTGSDSDLTLTSLKAALDQEIANREAKDVLQDAATNGLVDDVQQAQADIEVLEGVEAGHYQELKTAIETEAGRADTAEKANASAIEALAGTVAGNKTAIEGAVAGLQANVESEVERVEGLITAETAARETAVSGVDTKLTNEVNRATQAEEGISAVADAAKKIADTNALAISGIQGDIVDINAAITTEASTARDAEAALGARIKAFEDKALVEESDLTDIVKDINGLKSTVGGHTTSIAQHNEDILGLTNALNAEINTNRDTAINAAKIAKTELQGKIDAEVTAREEAIEKEVEDRDAAIEAALDPVNEALSGHTESISTLTKGLEDEIARADAAEKVNAKAISDEVKAREDAVKAVNDIVGKDAEGDVAATGLFKKIADEATRAKGVEGGLQQAINQEVSDRQKAVSDEATARGTAISTALQQAKDYTDSKLEAANAMHYKGSVAAWEDLPTTGVEAGWTYVVSGTGFVQDGQQYYPGDLIVADADQGTDATYAGGWTHVSTGYDAHLEQEMTVASNADNEAKVQLSSVSGADNGNFTIKADAASNLKLNLADNVITVSMAWADFGE